MSVPLLLIGGLQLATRDCKLLFTTGLEVAKTIRDLTALGAKVATKQTFILWSVEKYSCMFTFRNFFKDKILNKVYKTKKQKSLGFRQILIQMDLECITCIQSLDYIKMASYKK